MDSLSVPLRLRLHECVAVHNTVCLVVDERFGQKRVVQGPVRLRDGSGSERA